MKRRSGSRKVGGLSGHIVGIQYYDAKARLGEEVCFDRDPYNEFDANAVRASKVSGRPIGHLKREWSSWLASLLDSGKVFLKGRISGSGDEWRVPVEISVHTTRKGEGLFRKSREDSPGKVVHNHLLDIYGRADEYSPETLSKLRELYSGMVAGEGIAPETKLLFYMLEWRIGGGGSVGVEDAEKCVAAVSAALADLEFGTPSRFGTLTILPLFRKGKTPKRAPWEAGKKAIGGGRLVVEEIGSGEVSRLRATNKGRRPVMLVAGEGVKGAKQDRVINITIVVEPSKSVVLPVSCVERGRWRYSGSATFKSAAFATSAVRGRLLRDVAKNVAAGARGFRGDQDMVWHAVAGEARRHFAESPTENLNEVYEKRGEELEKALKKLRYPEGAVGAAVFQDGELVSIDVFPHPALASEYWGEIAKSAAMESLARGNRGGDAKKRGVAKRTAERMARRFLDKLLETPAKVESSPSSKGRVAVFDSGEASATAVIHDGRFAHLAGYRHWDATVF